MQVAVESLRSQVKRLRRFPSVVTFLYSSDQLPPPEVEQAYLDVFHSERWAVGLINSAVRLERLPIPVHLSCVCLRRRLERLTRISWRQSYVHSKLSGVSGVKMAGAQDRLHTAFLSRWAAAASHLRLGAAGPYVGSPALSLPAAVWTSRTPCFLPCAG